MYSTNARGWAVAAFGLLALIFTLPQSASAALGGDITSVQSDAVHMRASIRTVPGAAYTMHEMSDETGNLVRQYVSPQGKVFAVSWRGPVLPDLQQLLGTHFQEFQQAVAAPDRRIRGPVVIELPGLVVQSAGHMRSFTGRAYLPDSLPQGVSAKAIE